MKTDTLHRVYVWANALVSEFIEGACDSFIIVAGGSAVNQTAAVAPTAPLSLHAIGVSIAIGGAIYAASYLKKNPTPFPHDPPATPAPAASAS